MSYTYEGIEILLAVENFEKTALVCNTTSQQTVARLIQEMGQTQKSRVNIGVFTSEEEAEEWMSE